jgi:putative transcriptional regulator
MSSELTNRIRVFRAEHELSQSALADHIGVTRKTISTIEVGRFVPSTIIALKIADHFNVPVDEIFTLVKEPAQEKPKPEISKPEES